MVCAHSSDFSPAPRRRSTKGIPKPPSEARLIANRANALKSTGPRTAEGKARSSLNAFRHGLRARAMPLPPENRAEFDTFIRRFVADLKPRNVVQDVLAMRAATLAWSLQRVPEIAARLVQVAEEARTDEWMDSYGIGERLFEDAWGKTTEQKMSATRILDDEQIEERMEQYLEEEAEVGNFPPTPHSAAGAMADALAGGKHFGGMLRLADYERRLLNSFLAALRALERRQKLDEESEGDELEPEAPPATNEPNEAPAPVEPEPTPRAIEVPQQREDAPIAASSDSPIRMEQESPPATNEPNSAPPQPDPAPRPEG